MQIYQNKDFYFFRKPHWVASTFWKEMSFLDYMFMDKKKVPPKIISYADLEASQVKYIDQQMQTMNIDLIQNSKQQDSIIQDLINIFWKDLEFWLLNRLDNDTWGLLYFAKSTEIRDNYKLKQQQNLLKKFYIAQVNGNPFFKSNCDKINIDYPIMHHKFSEDRMLAILNPSDTNKWDWKQHLVSSKVFLLNFDKEQNTSTLLVSISKWIRHQIRVHLSSIWCPIIWENIYSNNKSNDFLHLWSIWFK